MNFEIKCPKCNIILEAESDSSGQEVECVNCNYRFKIPIRIKKQNISGKIIKSNNTYLGMPEGKQEVDMEELYDRMYNKSVVIIDGSVSEHKKWLQGK